MSTGFGRRAVKTWKRGTVIDRAHSQAVVVDASLTFRLIIACPGQAVVRDRFQEWVHAGRDLVAPTLWSYELTSALTKAVHFGDLTSEEASAALNQTFALNFALIAPDQAMAQAAMAWSVRLQRANAYDCFYLALADHLQAPLWTADAKLVRAANLSWVQLGTGV